MDKNDVSFSIFLDLSKAFDTIDHSILLSLTSVVCKLLETLIRDHMVEFLVKHKLINTSQHGFLKARLCLTNLLCFFEEITKWVDDGLPVVVVYLDFQKAFYKVPQSLMWHLN